MNSAGNRLPRELTRPVHVGRVQVGGGAPVSVQSMCTTKTDDPVSTLGQIRELEDTDIIGMVRENGMTMEQFAELFRRMQAAPAPATSEKEALNHD